MPQNSYTPAVLGWTGNMIFKSPAALETSFRISFRLSFKSTFDGRCKVNTK